MKNANFKKKHVPWAQTMCLVSFGPSLVFVWPALAFVGCCWPLFGLCWPVGVKMGGLDDAGVEMHRWGVEMRGWEPKHMVESRWVYCKENKSKKPKKLKTKKHLWPKRRQTCRLGSLLLLPPPKTSLCFY